MLARVVLAQDRPAQAVALLERPHAAAAAQNRAGSVIETQALRALALAASGEEAGAVDVFGRGAHPRLPAGLCPSVRRRGSAGGRAAGPTGRGPEDSTGRRARRLSTLSGPALAGLRPGADRPGAGDPSTASGAHAQPADRPRAGGQPRYGQKHVSHLLGKLGAANAPRPSPGPAARPDPLTGRPSRAALSCHVPPGNIPPLSTPPGDALPWLWFLPCSVTAPHRRVGTGPSGETLMSQARSVTPRTVSRSSPARSSCWAATRPSPPPCSPSPPSNSPYRPNCRPEGSGCSAPLLRTGPSQRRLVPPRFQVLPAKTSC